MCIFRLSRGSLFQKSPGHPPTDFVRTLLKGGEIQILDLVTRTKDLAGNLAEDFIQTSIRDGVARGAKHGKSSVTASNCPD